MTKKELRKISLQFRTLSSQMLKIDSEEEITHIKTFYNFITETSFIHDYIVSCHHQDYDFEKLYDQYGYTGKHMLPSKQEDLIDYDYQLIQFILESTRRLSTFGFNYTSSNSFDDMISAFMRKVIEPFVIAIRSYLELSMIDAVEGDQTTISGSDTVTAFLSYCQKDSDIANLIDDGLKARLKDAIHISRDIRDVDYHESFKQFMQSIQDHDYVIILISDRYLKSRNCMFEVMETIKDVRYQNRLQYIVLQDEDKKHLKKPSDDSIAADVYSNNGQTKYIIYWSQKENELQQQIEQIGDPARAINQVKEKKTVQKIILDLSDFLEFVKDCKGLSLETHLSENFESMCRFMGF